MVYVLNTNAIQCPIIFLYSNWDIMLVIKRSTVSLLWSHSIRLLNPPSFSRMFYFKKRKCALFIPVSTQKTEPERHVCTHLKCIKLLQSKRMFSKAESISMGLQIYKKRDWSDESLPSFSTFLQYKQTCVMVMTSNTSCVRLVDWWSGLAGVLSELYIGLKSAKLQWKVSSRK